MTSNFSVIAKKYAVPALFLIIGLAMFIFGMKENQDATFRFASIMMFVAGGLSVLYSTGQFKTTFIVIFGGLAGVAALATLWMSWDSVSATAKYNEDYKLCRGKSIQNLSDIRYAQKEYAEKFGVYAKDWKTLVDFVETGTVAYVDAKGVVPGRKITEIERDLLYTGKPVVDNNMTEMEAYRLSKLPSCPEDLLGFKRDTIQISLKLMKYSSKSYIEGRLKAGYGKFYSDSLPYIPFTGGREMWKLETKDSVLMGDQKVPTIQISGDIPFARVQTKGKAKEYMSLGKLTTNETSGTWEE
jgi:hypothetical protein